MRHIALSQQPDGRLKAHSCSDRWDCHGYIEDYSCQWVESLRIYYDATGDKEFVREMWPALVGQMKWFLDRRTPRGLVLAREYTSFDNPLAYVTCEGATLNAFLCQALRDAAYLGQAIGERQQADAYTKAAAELTDVINKQLWNEKEGAYNAGFYQDRLLGPTPHAALIALDRQIVPKDRIPRVRQWFLANFKHPGSFHCGTNPDFDKMITDRAGINMPVTYYWVFNVLYRHDSAESDLEVLREIRRRWATMVEHGKDTGTITEAFHEFNNGSESCHNYGAVPASFLSAYVLGVRLESPVWNKRLLIEPRLGDLQFAEGVVVTELGPVSVSWERTEGDKGLLVLFDVPKGAKATVRIPMASNTSTLTLNGKTLLQAGKPSEGCTVRGRWAEFEAAAGEYRGTME